ncbi:glycoside hydrolase family 10 protein [Sediminicola luteus]|uniref:Glycosyl hydrolase-like 10 domain-containing protein n=1 Tax=Sediminicola luteus TaxID=319238 RepID=A0A2A4GA17_9FLAO|nr:family 10 glycosylhydrolase [Sediminicola luteus]PCE64820.1 hypothetical protein B7P33_06530 [Sediminicola luteus]
MRYIFLAVFCLLVLNACTILQKPLPESEFRGVWVATVANIDWPKHPNDSWTKKQADFIEILDFYKNNNFNAAIVQVRTAGDAFYPSKLAPWSRFLTGTEGEAITDMEDPLAWMINETHKRGLEFHAWLNPYRATFDSKIEVLHTSHDYFTHPEWMIPYGPKNYYDPGNLEVQAHLTDIVAEIATNYPIDAIHFDDYFYPYKRADATFNDSLSFQKNKLPGQALEDWRRSNIDSLVKKVHRTIKQIKPQVAFGISPFGVWKNNSTDPKGSATKAGQTTYEDLYADPILWAQQGWIDYLAPQLYWSMDYDPAAHRVLAHWWNDQNLGNTKLYIGNGPYKIRNNQDQAWHDKKELDRQLSLARELENVQGNLFFSAKSLMHDKDDIVKRLRRKKYHNPAAIAPLYSQVPLETIQVQHHIAGDSRTFSLPPHVTSSQSAYVFKNKISPKKYLTQIFANDQGQFTLPQHLKNPLLVFVDDHGQPIAQTKIDQTN